METCVVKRDRKVCRPKRRGGQIEMASLLRTLNINQCILRVENGVKKVIVIMNSTTSSPTLYQKTYDDDLSAAEKQAFDDLVAFSANDSATNGDGSYPTAVPDPADPSDPVIDDIILQIINGNKSQFVYKGFFSFDPTVFTYAGLAQSEKDDYDTLASYADTVDNGFI
jgi:hypothetical protein